MSLQAWRWRCSSLQGTGHAALSCLASHLVRCALYTLSTCSFQVECSFSLNECSFHEQKYEREYNLPCLFFVIL